jgi:hypothetical protein
LRYFNVELLLSKKKSGGSIMTEFLRRVRAVVWDRAFLETRDGLFGLGPPGMAEGDKICILLGCSVPVILRGCETSVERDHSMWKIIGEAFVYGLMDGKAISELSEKRLERAKRDF